MKTQTAIKQAMSAYFSIIHYIIYVGKTDTPHKSATQRPRFPPFEKGREPRSHYPNVLISASAG